MDWLVDLLYYEGDLLKSFLATFGLMFMLTFLLEIFYIIRSGVMSLRR